MWGPGELRSELSGQVLVRVACFPLHQGFKRTLALVWGKKMNWSKWIQHVTLKVWFEDQHFQHQLELDRNILSPICSETLLTWYLGNPHYAKSIITPRQSCCLTPRSMSTTHSFLYLLHNLFEQFEKDKVNGWYFRETIK